LIARVTDPDANSLQVPAWNLAPSACSGAAPIDLTAGVPGNARGAAVTVQASTNVSNASNALGAPNGSGAYLANSGSRFVLDLGTTLYPGDRLQLIFRSNSSNAFTVALAGSETTSASLPLSSGLTTTASRFHGRWVSVTTPTRYLWISNTTNNGGHVDAVRWVKIGHSAGTFTWNSTAITQFDPAAAGLGTHTITYSIGVGSCVLSTPRQIAISSAPTGTITGPTTLCSGATGTFQLTSTNADQFIWQRSNAGSGSWVGFNTTQQTVALALPTATDLRVGLRSTSCPEVSYSNTITVTPGDNVPPVLPVLPDIGQTTTSASCSTAVALNIPVANDDCTACDPGSVTGYTRLGVYRGHAYYVSNNTSDWVTANNGATATGGHLVSITSPEENAWIASLTAGQILYIGLNDIAVEGQFVWTSGEPVSFEAWADDQPDNGYVLNQDWGAINFDSPGMWDDDGGMFYIPRRHILEFDCAVWQSAGPVPPALFPVGSTLVSFSAVDARGNQSTTSYTVMVTDNHAPAITFPSASVELARSSWPNCTAALPDLTAQASVTESCAFSIHQRPAAGTLLHSDTTVWIMARDAGGNTDSVPVVIRLEDQSGPVITDAPNGQSIIVANAGDIGVPFMYPMPVVQDCSPVTATLITGPMPGGFFPLGATEVRWRFTDTSGNSSEHSFVVTVGANDAPQLACPTIPQVVTEPGQCSALVNYTPPIAVDAQDGNITAFLVPPSLPPGPFPLGTSVVTFRAQDQAGNMATCSFSVTVVDGEPPSITCPPSRTLNTAVNECSVFTSWLPPVVSDNCPSCAQVTAYPDHTLLGDHDGKRYFISNDPATYDDAVATAQSLGHHLVSIGTPAENAFVQASMNAVGIEPVWIGLTDELVEGEFRWHSGEVL
ncbi:MAG: HYR domain-containing protein, partial [Flavobacteriales bacterium]